MNRLIIVAALAVGLSGCLQTTVTQDQIDVARQTYNAAFLAPAKNYRALGYCKAGTAFTVARPCADRGVVARLRIVDADLHTRFDKLQAEVTAGGGVTAVSDFSAIEGLITTARNIVATLPTN